MATKFITVSIEDLDGLNIRYSCMRNKELTTSQAFLLCLFADIDTAKNIPSNSKIANFMGTSKQAVSRNISILARKGFIEKEDGLSDKKAFESMSKGTLYKNGCILCGYSKCTLDEHHYPIRAKDGGHKTISLCPNCHRLFHEKTDYNRRITLTNKAKEIL